MSDLLSKGLPLLIVPTAEYGPMPRVYIAYHVDLWEGATAHYKLAATEDEPAVEEARRYLARHQSIEVWNGSRRVARLVREEQATPQRH